LAPLRVVDVTAYVCADMHPILMRSIEKISVDFILFFLFFIKYEEKHCHGFMMTSFL